VAAFLAESQQAENSLHQGNYQGVFRIRRLSSASSAQNQRISLRPQGTVQGFTGIDALNHSIADTYNHFSIRT
jgi:hypothetical protein